MNRNKSQKKSKLPKIALSKIPLQHRLNKKNLKQNAKADLGAIF